jgi:hypothetical protein
MNTTMLTALLQGVQGQRFKLSLSGEAAMVDGVNTYLSTLAELGEKNTDLFIEKGNQPYQ